MALRIATIPVVIHTLLGKVVATDEMVADKIVRATEKVPVRARPHGKGREGTPF